MTYRLQSGETWGEEPVPAGPTTPPPPGATLADRAHVAKRLAAQDPKWGERSPESRRLLVNLALREPKREKGISLDDLD